MLSNEQKFLMQCLACFLDDRPNEMADPATDWMSVMELAASHSVDAIVYHQCLNDLPVEVRKAYLKPYLGHAALSARREGLVTELAGELEAHWLTVMFLKGAILREYYPLPPLRSMGDLDILIRPEDRQSIDHVLKEHMGLRCYPESDAVWTYWRDNLYLEVHTHIFYEDLANRVDYRTFFDRIWEHCHAAPVFGISSENFLVPEENYHFLYLMAHTAKHVVNRGSGFRAYLDMVLMTKHCDLDWAWLEDELRKLELLEFTRTCFALCENWFGVRMPLGGKQLSEAFLEEVTEKTFRDGAFGKENGQNAGSLSAKEIRRRNCPYVVSAAVLTVRKIFPPYRNMRQTPWYSWVDGKPWLMPVAWIYRWWYSMKYLRVAGVDQVTEPFTGRKMVEKREALLREWGL